MTRDNRKSILMKSFSNTKDNRGNCAMEQGDMMKAKQLESKRAMAKLLIVCGLSFIFMITEFVGGYISGSLAIMTDAAHMLSDVAGFMISYFAIYMGSKPANFSMSFGYHRAEILGALTSILLIWGLLIWLFAEAIGRIIKPEPVNGEIMLITACVGLIFNIIAIFTLHNFGGSHHGHSHGEEDHKHDEEKRLSHCHLP
jgi:zinc transporter 2